MSSEDMKPVSVHTGTFAALKLAPEQGADGNAQPISGNKLPEVAEPDMEVLARELNVATRTIGRDLRFQVNMQTGHSVIQVLDRETGEIIRQIPPEKAKTYMSERGAVALRLYDDLV
ncbi:MAG: flagellar protein FlaG [Pseudomonadota bacterium]